MTKTPKISVIIPVYNTEKYLAECLDSVLKQSFTDIEIICVNDGSTDKSAEILKDYAKKDKRIKIITQENSGVVVARNNGVAHATADLIYPLDSDDIISPMCLEILYKAFISGKGDIITCKVKYFGNEDGEMILSHPSKYNMAHANCFVNAALFKKSDFDLAGGYDEKYNIALEDYDLWLNLMFNHNKTVYRVPEILFFYRQKPHAEARNWQHRDRHKDICKTFRIKYPQIKKYLLLRNIVKPFVKIRRFFFRIENNKIKIFKVPVARIGNKLNLYYFDSRPNFGDLLNIDIFKKIFNIDVQYSDIQDSEVIAIGSLFELLFSKSNHFIKRFFRPAITVWGTGFIQEQTQKNYYPIRKMKIYAVRGYLTYERLKKYGLVKPGDNIAIGDPGLLVSKLINTSKIKKKYDLGIIPHYVDQNNPLLNNIKVKNSIVLDITKNPIDFLHDIAECKTVISSAMHGLIAADSLGIPNIRMILSDKITGGDYKYDDYYSAFSIKKHNRIDLRVSEFTEKDLKQLHDNYQIKPEKVLQKQIELLNAFPYKKE